MTVDLVMLMEVRIGLLYPQRRANNLSKIVFQYPVTAPQVEWFDSDTRSFSKATVACAHYARLLRHAHDASFEE